MQVKKEKEIKYIRQVGNMQKTTLEKKITVLEKDLKENREKELALQQQVTDLSLKLQSSANGVSDSSPVPASEELDQKLKEMQAKNDKELKYVRQVGNMQKVTLERRITALEKDLKDKEEKLKET